MSMAPASAAAPAAMLSTRTVRGLSPASGTEPPSATAITSAATTTRLARRRTASSPRGLPELPSAFACHIDADHSAYPQYGVRKTCPQREGPVPPINESLIIMVRLATLGHGARGTPAQVPCLCPCRGKTWVFSAERRLRRTAG